TAFTLTDTLTEAAWPTDAFRLGRSRSAIGDEKTASHTASAEGNIHPNGGFDEENLPVLTKKIFQSLAACRRERAPAVGRVMRKVVPRPGALSTEMWPECSCTMP